MIRSFYTATSGAITENRNLNVLSNNIANAGTTGFKRDIPVSSTFDEVMIARLNSGTGQWIGDASFVRYNAGVATDNIQGSIIPTGRTLDFALQGEGYFKMMDINGEYALTRDGECVVDPDGFLAHAKGGLLLDNTDAPIYLGTSEFEVNSKGEIYVSGEYNATIGVTQAYDPNQLIKSDRGGYIFNDEGNLYPSEDINIVWKALESANVNMTDEMSKTIASSRSFQACTQVMKMLDELTQKTVNEIGRM